VWPASCRFRERCRFAESDCGVTAIPIEWADDREVRCIHWDELVPARPA
jgi:hypothetical protein